MDTQPKPWQANTSYKLEDRVTIRIEEKVIFVLRCIREGMSGATTPTIRRGLGSSHTSWNQYDIKQSNKVSDDECDWIVEKVI
jgi:hypothetical protein